MGDMVMGKCEHTQRNYFHIQTNYKCFQGGYGNNKTKKIQFIVFLGS